MKCNNSVKHENVINIKLDWGRLYITKNFQYWHVCLSVLLIISFIAEALSPFDLTENKKWNDKKVQPNPILWLDLEPWALIPKTFSKI